jgi:Fe2+ transport system protein B
MSIFSTIGKFITKQFWPWFIKYGWPIIKEYVIEILIELLKGIKDVIIDIIKKKKKKYDEYSKKAEEAEQNAKTASSETEKEKFEKIAKIWREVAEDFRKENEDLKNILDLEIEKKIQQSKEQIQSIEPKLDFQKETKLILNENTYSLPDLNGVKEK